MLAIGRLLVCCAVLLLTAPAFGQSFENPHPFERFLGRQIQGGRYFVGEDNEISARLRAGRGVDAMFQIVKPHRTREFGSGVAFLIYDAKMSGVVRISVNDSASKTMLELGARLTRDLHNDKEWSPLLLDKQLSIPRKQIARMALRVDKTNRIFISIDRQTWTIDPGFAPYALGVQIYCADAWVRFGDRDLAS